MSREEYLQRLFTLKGPDDFEDLALKVFRFQARFNKVYRRFISGLGLDVSLIRNIEDIPFLPVELFKSHEILSGNNSYEGIFTSSGTTGESVSRHFIKSIGFYKKICMRIFQEFYGNPKEYTILALLPSYLERSGSSLIVMMQELLECTGKKESGFYLHEHEKLSMLLHDLKSRGENTILFGVTYALLDFAAAYKMKFPGLIVMDTGGMKGKRKEMIRDEVHAMLCEGFGVNKIHSEYGMTELLSQAYSNGEGRYRTPAWMKVIIRDPYDPLQTIGNNTSGGINIIDLANIDSCAFLATQDLGKKYADDSFEVLGRFDFSDVRGCNLMIV